MEPREIARKWREGNGYVGRGGVIVIHGVTVNSWVNELRDPEHWIAGCIAIDESGNEWVAVGGDEHNGAERWDQIRKVA